MSLLSHLNVGAASRMADSMLSVLEPLGPVGILFGVFIATATMSAFISNVLTPSLNLNLNFFHVTFPSLLLLGCRSHIDVSYYVRVLCFCVLSCAPVFNLLLPNSNNYSYALVEDGGVSLKAALYAIPPYPF